MEWRPIPNWPEYEISERGAIRRADTGYRLTVRGLHATLSRGGVLCRVHVAQARDAAFAREPEIEAEPAALAAPTANPEVARDVLPEETTGASADQAPGPLPRRRREALPGRAAPRRHCHDCGKPTANYRCPACWRRVRGDRSSDTYDPMCE